MFDNYDHCQSRLHSETALASTVEEAVYLLSRTGGSTLDIMLVMGGMGRWSDIATRRRLVTGKNFDIVAGCDLGDPKRQAALKT